MSDSTAQQTPVQIYTVVFHDVKQMFGFNDAEYTILDGIAKLSKQGKQWCYASVKYLMDVYRLKRSTVKRAIASLIKKGYVEIDRISRNKTLRRITPKCVGSFISAIQLAKQGFDPKPVLGYSTTPQQEEPVLGYSTTPQQEEIPQENIEVQNEPLKTNEWFKMNPSEVQNEPLEWFKMNPNKHSNKQIDKESVSAQARTPAQKPQIPKQQSMREWQIEMVDHFYRGKSLRAERRAEGWTPELVVMLLKWFQALDKHKESNRWARLSATQATNAVSTVRSWLLASTYPLEHIKEQIEAVTDNCESLSNLKDRCRDRLNSFNNPSTRGACAWIFNNPSTRGNSPRKYRGSK